MSQRSSRIPPRSSRWIRTLAAILALGVSLAAPGAALADTSVMVETPAGFLPVQPSTVIQTTEHFCPQGVGYCASGTVWGSVGTPMTVPQPEPFGAGLDTSTGVALAGSIDPAIEPTDSDSTCPTESGATFNTHDGFEIDLIDPTRPLGQVYGAACVPLGTTSLDGVMLWGQDLNDPVPTSLVVVIRAMLFLASIPRAGESSAAPSPLLPIPAMPRSRATHGSISPADSRPTLA